LCLAQDDRGALLVKERVPYKDGATRVMELGLDKDTRNQTNTPAKDPKKNHSETVNVVQAEGTIEDRVVPPSRGGKHKFEIPGHGKEGEAVHYHDSVYDYVEERGNGSSTTINQDVIALSLSQDIDLRGEVSHNLQAHTHCLTQGNAQLKSIDFWMFSCSVSFFPTQEQMC
jgi:hypothetical protein